MTKKKQGPVLKTLKEIESLFEFGGEIAPFLEELFAFLSDLMPILAKASRSLENTTASMPAASDNITSANIMVEDATHTIMDNVEHITVELDKLIVDQSDGDLKEALQDLAGKVAEISMTLQFQDITSQHLRQATLIVEAIQMRMEKLFESLKSIGEKNELVKKIVESYTQGTDEEAIDTTDRVRKEAAISQTDIDALFGT
ncbi:MAG: hypothetical protein GH143_04775 [Calditrichaeota bacterium]|nr:hypothetical protein [Calditrichota bacterium]